MSHHVRAREGRRLPALLAAVGVLLGLMTWSPAPAAAEGQFRTEDLTVESGSGADRVELDVTLYIPRTASESEPVPAIIFPHGYGATKDQPKGQATKFARQGYVGLTYSARGFGQSTGEISIDSPDYEIADARELINMLSERPEVLSDAPGDPRVGILGGSYAGGVALLTAAYDERVDVIAASRTWNSLVNSLFPDAAGAPAAETPAAPAENSGDGAFKKLWGQFFFEGGALDESGGDNENGGSGNGGSGGACGGLRPEYCTAYEGVLREGQLTEEMRALLERSSPASVIDRIRVPTLLTQGEGDKLFSLAEADANARGIAANGAPVKLVWVTGGHGALRSNQTEGAMLDALNTQWFDFHLRGNGTDPGTSFDYTEIAEQALAGPTEGEIKTVAAYPGLGGAATTRLEVPISGEAQELDYPAGGTPGAVSSLPPGVSSQSGERRPLPAEIPEQNATFESEALVDALTVVGSPVVNIQVASTSGEAVVFGKVYDIAADGSGTLIQSLVAPARFTDLPGSLDQAPATSIVLPAMAHRFEEGHSIRVILSSTDQGYATPGESATYQIALADGTTGVLSVPDVSGQPAPEFTARPRGVGNIAFIAGGAAAAVLVIGAVAFLLIRRRRRHARPTRW